MIRRFFHASAVNTARIQKHLFLWMLWAGCGIMAAGCATGNPQPSEQKECPPVSQAIRFYQGPLDHLSAVRQGGCPMEPNCSAYAVEAVERHGPLLGLVMTFDRLIRCGHDETHLSPEIWVNGHRRIYDPLTANEWNPQNTPPPLQDWEISVE